MVKNGKLFGIFNILDVSVVLIILLAVSGIALVKLGKFSTSSHLTQKQGNIEFDVVSRGVKLSTKENIFKPGDKTFITIRNVPYTSLEIVKSTISPWQTSMPDPKDPKKAIAVTDPTESNTYNFLITLRDKALITDDGPIIGGNKIKIGLTVNLEGFKYRLNGTVSDVRVVK